MRRCRIQIDGNYNTIIIGDGSRLTNMKILVEGDGHTVEIGCGCRLTGKIKVEDANNLVVIGDQTTMEDGYIGAYDVGTRVMIGRDCMFAEHVGLRNGDMHSIVDGKTGKRINPSKDIVVSDHVWLGRGVTVLKGVLIGHDSVVGAHSVVTRDIPSSCLAVGSPAKPIREEITWDRRRLKVEEVDGR